MVPGRGTGGMERPLFPDSSYLAPGSFRASSFPRSPSPYHLLLELPDPPLGLLGSRGRKEGLGVEAQERE